MVYGAAIWPATLECGDLSLRPIRYRDRHEWMAVRRRNARWLEPWEASNPAPGGYLPQSPAALRRIETAVHDRRMIREGICKSLQHP